MAKHSFVWFLVLSLGLVLAAKCSAGVIENQQLTAAAMVGDVRSLQDLINKGADVNSTVKDGLTPLMLAAQMGGMVGQGASSAFTGFVDVTRVLIEKRAQVNAKDTEGKTALMWASQNGSVDIARLLIKKGHADVKAKDKSGKTALVFANDAKNSKKIHIEQYDTIISMLKAAGAK